MKKRILSFLLATVMAITSMPLVSFADDTHGGQASDQIIDGDGNSISVQIGQDLYCDGFRVSVANMQVTTPIKDYTWESFGEASETAVVNTYNHALPYGGNKAIYLFDGVYINGGYHNEDGEWIAGSAQAKNEWSVYGDYSLNNKYIIPNVSGKGYAYEGRFSGGYYVGGQITNHVFDVTTIKSKLKDMTSVDDIKSYAVDYTSDQANVRAYLGELYARTEGGLKDGAIEVNSLFGFSSTEDTNAKDESAKLMLWNMYVICAITSTDPGIIDSFLDKYYGLETITEIPMIQVEALYGTAVSGYYDMSLTMGQLINYAKGVSTSSNQKRIFDAHNGVAAGNGFVTSGDDSLLAKLSILAGRYGKPLSATAQRDVTLDRVLQDGKRDAYNGAAISTTTGYFKNFDSNMGGSLNGKHSYANMSELMGTKGAMEYPCHSFFWLHTAPPPEVTPSLSFNAKAIWEEKAGEDVIETIDIERKVTEKVAIDSYYRLTSDASVNEYFVTISDPKYKGDDKLKGNVTLEVKLFTSELVPVATVNPPHSSWTSHHYTPDTPSTLPVFCGDVKAISGGTAGNVTTITLTPSEFHKFVSGDTGVYFYSEHFRPWIMPDLGKHKTEFYFKVTVSGLEGISEDPVKVRGNNIYVTPIGTPPTSESSRFEYQVTKDEIFPEKKVDFNWSDVNSAADISNINYDSTAEWHFISGAQDAWKSDISFTEASEFLTQTMEVDQCPDIELVIKSPGLIPTGEGVEWSISVPHEYGDGDIKSVVLQKLSVATSQACNGDVTEPLTFTGEEANAFRSIVHDKTEWSIYGCIKGGQQKETASVSMTFTMEIFVANSKTPITGAPVTVTKTYPIYEEIPEEARVIYHVAALPKSYLFRDMIEGPGYTSPKKLYDLILEDMGKGRIEAKATVSVTFTIEPEMRYVLKKYYDDIVAGKLENGTIEIEWEYKPSTSSDYMDNPVGINWTNYKGWGANTRGALNNITSKENIKSFLSKLLEGDSFILTYDCNDSDDTNPEFGYRPGDTDVLTAFAIDFLCNISMELKFKNSPTVTVVPFAGMPDHDTASWVSNLGFTYNSALRQNYIEIKEGTPLNEEYDALSAMPTDRTMFYAAGGSEFLIVANFELRKSEGHVRSYEIKAEGTFCNHDFATLTYNQTAGKAWQDANHLGCTGDVGAEGITRTGDTKGCVSAEYDGKDFCTEVLKSINCYQTREQWLRWVEEETPSSCPKLKYEHYSSCCGHEGLMVSAFEQDGEIYLPPTGLDEKPYTVGTGWTDKIVIENVTFTKVGIKTDSPDTITKNVTIYSRSNCSGHNSGHNPDKDGHCTSSCTHKCSHSAATWNIYGTGTAPCVNAKDTIIGYSYKVLTTSTLTCNGAHGSYGGCGHAHTSGTITTSLELTPVKCSGQEAVTYDSSNLGFATAVKGDTLDECGVNEEGNFTNVIEENYDVSGIHEVAAQHCACTNHCGLTHRPCKPHIQTYTEKWTTRLGSFPYMAITDCQVWRLEDSKMKLNEELNYTDEVLIGESIDIAPGNGQYGQVYIYRGLNQSNEDSEACGRLVYSWHPEAGLIRDGLITIDLRKYLSIDYSSKVDTLKGGIPGMQGDYSYEKRASKEKEYGDRYEYEVSIGTADVPKWYTSTICSEAHSADEDKNIPKDLFQGLSSSFVENHGLVYYKYLQYLDSNPINKDIGTKYGEVGGDSYDAGDGSGFSVTVVSDFLVLFGHDNKLQIPYYHDYTVYPTKEIPSTYNLPSLKADYLSKSNAGEQLWNTENCSAPHFITSGDFIGFTESSLTKMTGPTAAEYTTRDILLDSTSNTGTITRYDGDETDYYTTTVRHYNPAKWDTVNKSSDSSWESYVIEPDSYTDFLNDSSNFGPEGTQKVIGEKITDSSDPIWLDFWFANGTSSCDSYDNYGSAEPRILAKYGIDAQGIVLAGYTGEQGDKYITKSIVDSDETKYESDLSNSTTFPNRPSDYAGIGIAFNFKHQYMTYNRTSQYDLLCTQDGQDRLYTLWFNGQTEIPVNTRAVNKKYTYDDNAAKCFYHFLDQLFISDRYTTPLHGNSLVGWAGKNGFEVPASINDVCAYDPIAVVAGVDCPDENFYDQRTDESKLTQVTTDDITNVESGGTFKFSLTHKIQEQNLNNQSPSVSAPVNYIANEINSSYGFDFPNSYYMNRDANTGEAMDTTPYCSRKYIIANNYLIVDTNGNGSFADEFIYPPDTEIDVDMWTTDASGNTVPLSEYAFYIPSMAYEMREMRVQFIAETINDPSTVIENDEVTNVNEWSGNNLDRYHEAVDEVTITVVGRIGNLTMVDSGDFRYATFFKCISGIAGDWLVPNVVQGVDASKQNSVVIDTYDIYQNKYGSDNTHYNTYGSQPHKYAVDGEQVTLTSQYQFPGRPNYFSFPLMPVYNNITAFQTAPPRVGYTTYLDIETIGEYYTGDSYVTVEYAYYGLPASGDDLVPLDVFMWRDDEYVLINDFYNTRDEELYSYPIFMNWADSKIRRMYTEEEASRTAEVNAHWRDTGYVDMKSKTYIDPNYIMELGPYGFSTYQGDCETVYLGYDSRTFIGNYIYEDVMEGFGDSNNTDVAESVNKWMFYRDSQKWYFSNELPSSAVFVRAGEQPTEENIKDVKENYPSVVVTAHIIAHGPVWDLQHDGLPSWGHLREWYPDIPDDPVYPPTDPDDPLDPDEPDDPDTPDDPDNPDDPDDPDDPPDDPPPPTVIMIIPPDKSSRDDLDTSGTH